MTAELRVQHSMRPPARLSAVEVVNAVSFYSDLRMAYQHRSPEPALACLRGLASDGLESAYERSRFPKGSAPKTHGRGRE